MSKYVKNQDTTDSWMIDEDGQNWTLGTNATISVANEAAINIAATFDDNIVKLRGDLVAIGAAGEGVRIEGEDSLLRLFKTSQIEANVGVYNASTNSSIINAGDIVGDEAGILSETTTFIRNAGHVSGDSGILTGGFGGTVVENLAKGVIEGEDVALRMSGSAGSEIFNAGKIMSDDVAISVGSDGASELTNRGKIIGDVLFGAGEDRIDTIGGRIKGLVDGGGGDDMYYVGKHHGRLSETMGNGWDTVNTKVGMTLPENFEQLNLLGKKSIDGTGNAGGNDIFGNAGDNVVRGKGGNDYIGGGEGKDQLIGGSGADDFVFTQGDGRDVVQDFEIDADRVALLGFDLDSFDDLLPLLSQHGDDTWVSLGNGDRVILKNVAMDDLGDDNFVFNFLVEVAM